MAHQEISQGGLRWIHIHQPTDSDLAFVRSLHTFDEIVLDYIASPTLHPSLEEFGDNIYFILHFPVIYQTDEPNKSIEVDFLMTKTLLITFTYERYERLESLFEQYRNDKLLSKKYFRSHSGYMLYFIFEHLYEHMINDHDYIEKSITSLEHDIFSTPSETLVKRIADIARDILDFRRVFNTQGSILELLPRALERMLGKNSIPKFTNIVVTQNRIQRLLDNHKETIDSLQATHSALIESKTSRIVKVLTIFSAIILPLSLVSGIWGMNHKFLPLRDHVGDFWVVILIMIVLACSLIAAFKRARWL